MRANVLNLYGNLARDVVLELDGVETADVENGAYVFPELELDDGEYALKVFVGDVEVFSDDVEVENNAVVTPVYVRDDENLLVNPGFELGMNEETGEPVGWTGSANVEGGKFYVVQDPVSGNYAAAVEHTLAKSIHVRQDYPASEGEVFFARATVKSSVGNSSIGVYVRFINANGTEIQKPGGGAEGNARTTTNTTWIELETPPYTAPAGTESVRVQFWQGSAANGSTTYIDDVQLFRVE